MTYYQLSSIIGKKEHMMINMCYVNQNVFFYTKYIRQLVVYPKNYSLYVHNFIHYIIG